MFEGRKILLTGGAGSLGGLLSRLLLDAGASVTVLDRVEPAHGTDFWRHDLSSVEGVETAVRAVAEHRWDILVNLAGILYFGPVEDQPPVHLHASYMVNLIAPVRLTQAVMPRMKASGGGQIVNIGSVFGSINFAHFATYSSTKAGLRGFSQALRREVAGAGIAVTYIAPRAVRSAFNTAAVMAFAKLTHMNLDSPDLIAAWICEAIRLRKAEAYFGFPENLFVRLNAILPGVVDRALGANDRKVARLFAE